MDETTDHCHDGLMTPSHVNNKRASSWIRVCNSRVLRLRLRLPALAAVAILLFVGIMDAVRRPGDAWASLTKWQVSVTNGTGFDVDAAVDELVQRYRVEVNRSLAEGLSPWEIASGWVTARQVVPEPAHLLDCWAPLVTGAVLDALARAEVTFANTSARGTQLKLDLVLEGSQMVVFKPMFYERNTVLPYGGTTGRDRHNGEIASFHLSRILNLRRVPVAVGRRLNLLDEITPVATHKLLETFYVKDGNDCFYGECSHCNPTSGVCARGDLLEGVIILWLPPTVTLSTVRHPWRQSYKANILKKYNRTGNSPFETYCELVRSLDVFVRYRYLLLDIADTAIFDFLIGNNDRHQIQFNTAAKAGMLVMLDNGKSFGNPYHDELTIIGPVTDCCMLRASTWARLQQVRGGVLSRVLREVLKSDPAHPVLMDSHLSALDRRLQKVFQELNACIQKSGLDKVLVDDGLT